MEAIPPMRQVVAAQDSAMTGRRILDMHLPKRVLIVMINRNGKYITPRGTTVIQSIDELTLIANDQHELQTAINLAAPGNL